MNNNMNNHNMNNHNMSNMNNNNNSNNFNKAPFNQNNNAINTNTPVNFNNPGARNNFNSAPNNNNFNSATNNNNNNSRQSFNSTNNGNNFGNNNKNFINQNENIPPYGTNNNNNNNSKGGKRVSAVSFINDASNIPDNEFIPVNLLAPFSQFLIKVRVTNKSDVREFKKNGGPEMGKLFSVDLIDKEGYEISATFFGDAVDKWFPVIFENQVYIMGGGQVKVINSKFNKK